MPWEDFSNLSHNEKYNLSPIPLSYSVGWLWMFIFVTGPVIVEPLTFDLPEALIVWAPPLWWTVAGSIIWKKDVIYYNEIHKHHHHHHHHHHHCYHHHLRHHHVTSSSTCKEALFENVVFDKVGIVTSSFDPVYLLWYKHLHGEYCGWCKLLNTDRCRGCDIGKFQISWMDW